MKFKKSKNNAISGKAIILTSNKNIVFDKFIVMKTFRQIVKIKLNNYPDLINIYKSQITNGTILLQKIGEDLKPINSDLWYKIKLHKFGIKRVNYNLQNFRAQESKSAMHRWVLSRDLIQKLTPFITLLIVGISVGVVGWLGFKIMLEVFHNAIAPRLADCASILPKVPLPPGVVS